MDCDIFVVGNHMLIDDNIFEIWLQGFSVDEACNDLIRNGALNEMDGTNEACVLSDIMDHFRVFELLEKHLENPKRLTEHCPFPIDLEMLENIIERYYDFNDSVVREFLGKKLTTRVRKDLDDVAEKTKIHLKSCQRQFDNFRRVFRAVEDTKGNLLINIQKKYLISEGLAKRYAAGVFITSNRFETNKKRLNYVAFNDFVVCASLMITHWTQLASNVKEDVDMDVDREFLQDLRELKVLLDKEHSEDLKW